MSSLPNSASLEIHQAGVKRARDDDSSTTTAFDLIQAMRLKAIASMRIARSAAVAPPVTLDDGATVIAASSDDDAESSDDDAEIDDEDEGEDEGAAVSRAVDSSTWQPPPCRWGAHCRADDCTFLHSSVITSKDNPITSDVLCRYGDECRSLRCPFTHTTDEKTRNALRRNVKRMQRKLPELSPELNLPRVQALINDRGGLLRHLCNRYKKKFNEAIKRKSLEKLLSKVAKVKSIDWRGRKIWERR